MNAPITAKLAVFPKPEINSEFALTALRTVVARLRLIEAEVTAIGLALKQGKISPRIAINLTDQIAPGCFGVVAESLGGDHD